MQILFSTAAFAVCVKPVGMDSEHEVPQCLSAQLGGEFFPVHRLDRTVGGVMVFARTRAAAAALSRCVQDGGMVKEYLAMVHGLPPSRGDWTDLLWKDSAKNKVYVVSRVRKGVKQARLEFIRLTDADPATVQIRLHTGRSHQIRVQFASRGYPLLGDHRYGARDELQAPRLFSCRLRFSLDGRSYCFTALPDWATELRDL